MVEPLPLYSAKLKPVAEVSSLPEATRQLTLLGSPIPTDGALRRKTGR
ncbi:hypothetical protein [Zavarzinella formosa]|nr:hypothetical protein [Zavarzinella formosa]